MKKNIMTGLGLVITIGIIVLLTMIPKIKLTSSSNDIENIITVQDIAEFAVTYDGEYGNIIDVEIDKIDYSETYKSDVIYAFVRTEDGGKYYTGISKNWYLKLMQEEVNRKDS